MYANPPADLEGVVTAVEPSAVEISLGYDDGVRKGHRFIVTSHTTNNYVGDIDVVRVDYPNRAVCRPVSDMMRVQIQKGDYVKASLKSGTVRERR